MTSSTVPAAAKVSMTCSDTSAAPAADAVAAAAARTAATFSGSAPDVSTTTPSTRPGSRRGPRAPLPGASSRSSPTLTSTFDDTRQRRHRATGPRRHRRRAARRAHRRVRGADEGAELDPVGELARGLRSSAVHRTDVDAHRPGGTKSRRVSGRAAKRRRREPEGLAVEPPPQRPHGLDGVRVRAPAVGLVAERPHRPLRGADPNATRSAPPISASVAGLHGQHRRVAGRPGWRCRCGPGRGAWWPARRRRRRRRPGAGGSRAGRPRRSRARRPPAQRQRRRGVVLVRQREARSRRRVREAPEPDG